MNLVSSLPSFERPPMLRLVNSWIDSKSLKTPRVPTTIVHDVPLAERIPSETRAMYLQGEPEIIIPQRAFLLNNAQKFHSILTFDDEVLRRCPNARKYIFGGCWVHPEDRAKVDPSTKTFSVSMLVGTKNWGQGHRYRSAIYQRQTDIKTVPYTFYRSIKTGSIPEITTNPLFVWDSKYELFRSYQFSVAIENSKQMNYFTEKVIDCFLTKTVPIYWGCPNIGEYFFTEGMIILQTATVEEFLEKVSALTPETYAEMMPMIEQNYQRALQYVRVEDNINRALQSIPDY